MAENEAVSDFILLPPEEQEKVLSNVNPDFNALPPQERQKVLQSIQADTVNVGRLFNEGGITQDQPEFTTAQKIFLKVEPFVKPAAEAGAALFGSAVGAAGGLATPIPGDEPILAVTGAGLALSGVRSFFRGVENMIGLRQQGPLTSELLEAGKDIVEGVQAEATGQILGPVVKGVGAAIPQSVKHPIRTIGDKLALTQRGAQTKALRRFEQEAAGTPITQPQIEKNIRVARTLEERIPGLQFTQGQLTNDASAISLERTLSRKGGQDLSQAQREFANKVLDDFFSKKVSGEGSVSAFIARVEDLKGQIVASTNSAEREVTSEVIRLSRNLDEQAIGNNILTKLSSLKKTLKERVSEQFNQIPNLKVDPQPLADKINAVNAEILKGEPAEDIPSAAFKLIRNLIFKETKGKPKFGPLGEVLGEGKAKVAIKTVDVKTIRGINRTLNNMIRKAESGLQPNKVLSRRLQILKEGVGESFDITAERGGQKGIDILEKANALRIELGTKFEKGTVADVLQRGRRGEATKIALGNIGKEFNSIDAIDDLSSALGSSEVAKEAMRNFYTFDLLNAAKDPSTGLLVTKKVNQWVARNAAKLRKLGLLEEFKNVESLQVKFEQSADMLNTFNKSVAARILEADTDNIIQNAFSGSKNFAKTASELMGLVRGDKAAEQGLKRAFADNIVRQSSTTAPTFFQQGGEAIADIEFVKSVAKLTNQIKKFSPAMGIIYRNEPAKVKALNDVWKAYQTIIRTAKSPAGGGSDTFELFGKTVDIVAGSTAPGQWYAFKTIRDIVNKFGAENVELYLRRAMFDPDYAQTLMAITKGGAPKRVEISAINKLMSLVALRSQEEFRESLEISEANAEEITKLRPEDIDIQELIATSAPFQQSRETSFRNLPFEEKKQRLRTLQSKGR